MRIVRLRHKLLLSAVAISMLLTAASMSAVSLVIHRQYLTQSTEELLKAAGVIKDGLAERKDNLTTAARQLATQKHLGSTIWYLAEYSRSDLDRETLFETYQQLVRDTYAAGRDARAARIAVYNSGGHLVSFAIFDRNGGQAGYADRFPVSSVRAATLKAGEDFNGDKLRTINNITGLDLEFGKSLPQQERVNFAVVDGVLSIESQVPIMDEAFDSNSGKLALKQLGLVTLLQPLDRSFIDPISRLTGTSINIFTAHGFSSGNLDAYRDIDWSSLQAGSEGSPPAVTLNDIDIDGTGYYQGLIPLYTGHQLVGAIATLHSKEVVQKSTREMIATLWWIAAASLLLIVPFAWYFATTISHPLTVLARIFRGVADSEKAGTMSAELKFLDHEKNRQDELGDLTQSFLAMNDAIEQKIREINEINASLEQTIAERTAALVAKEQESRTLIENTPDTIARYDRNCRHIYVNPAFAAMTEGGSTSLLGQKPSENIGGPHAKAYEEKIAEVLASGREAKFVLSWSGRDGKEFCSDIRLTPEFDLSGAVVTVLAVGRDVTEKEKVLQQLSTALGAAEEANRVKSRFLAAASHDLRQPIGAMRLFHDALNSTALDAEQRRICDYISQSTQSLADILNTLLDVSRLDGGMVKPQPQVVSADVLLSNIEAEFAPLARAKGLRFKLYSPQRELMLYADEKLLRSLLRNLIDNAIKYTDAGGILLGIRRRGETALIQVWDTGLGIAPEHLETIFEEYFQVGNPERDRTKGLGLGLAIAERLANILGCKISCTSRLSRGSTFAVSLPLAGACAGPLLPAQGRTAHPDFGGSRVVIVEDDAMSARALELVLGAHGMNVIAHRSAEDALADPRIGAADYYISDFRLPGMNGAQLLDVIQARAGRPIRAALLTGETSGGGIAGSTSGQWPVLLKPIDMATLTAAFADANAAGPNRG